MAEADATSESERERIAFNPSLYVQRDKKILELIKDSTNIIRVLDLGCAECRLIKKLKEIPHVEFICGIDLEKAVLESNAHVLGPIPWNSLFPRSKPLKIVLLHGSMLEVDEIMLGCDVVILSEVIEHLVGEDLAKLPEVVFSSLRPQMCIVTTPNAEFNVAFGNVSGKFRHPDHKFEWTRREFSQWCESITRGYPYSVEFDGVGDPPPTHPNVGFCSQIAVFRSNFASSDFIRVDIDPLSSHDMMAEIDYPHEDPTFLKNRVLSKIYFVLETETSILGSLDEPPSKPEGCNSWMCDDFVYVSFEKLMENETIQNYFGGVGAMRKFLEENNFNLHEAMYVKYYIGAPSSDEDFHGV